MSVLDNSLAIFNKKKYRDIILQMTSVFEQKNKRIQFEKGKKKSKVERIQQNFFLSIISFTNSRLGYLYPVGVTWIFTCNRLPPVASQRPRKVDRVFSCVLNVGCGRRGRGDHFDNPRLLVSAVHIARLASVISSLVGLKRCETKRKVGQSLLGHQVNSLIAMTHKCLNSISHYLKNA